MEKRNLTQEWDKVFPKKEQTVIEFQQVAVFKDADLAVDDCVKGG